MGKAGGKTVTTSGVDQNTQNYNNGIHGAAGAAANGYSTVGPDANTTSAADTYGKYAGAGANGLAALSGDPTAMAKFMDPYQQGVINASNNQYTKDSAQLDTNADSAATAAHAFGGSRAAVVKGAAQGELAGAHEQQINGLLSTGYNNAVNQAGNVANLGLAGAAGSADIGSYLRDIEQKQANPNEEKLRILQGGQTGPNSTTTTQQQPGTNWLQTAGSIAGMGASLFGPK
jgi:hypothetical protein